MGAQQQETPWTLPLIPWPEPGTGWLRTEYGKRLHAARPGPAGTAVCGHGTGLTGPGPAERGSMPRCRHCCRILHIPAGTGSPGPDAG